MKPATAARPYYSEKGASTAFYDVMTDADPALAGDVDLYAGMAPVGGSILELGAGTGRIALALAERGFQVTGLDIAPAMLALARAKRAKLAADAAGRLKFIRGDLTAFKLGHTFDAVICTYYALAHVPSGPAWASAFAAISGHLKPGGLAAVHLPLPAKMAGAPPPPTQVVRLLSTPDGGSLALYVAGQSMDPGTGKMDLVLRYVTSGPKGARESLERLTLYSGDPSPFAMAAGLESDRHPVDLGGTGLVHIFRKA